MTQRELALLVNQGDRSRDSFGMSDHGPVPLIRTKPALMIRN